MPVTSNAIDLCGRCRNYGIWLTPRGVINECPNLQQKFNDHRPLNLAAELVLRNGRLLTKRGHKIESQHVFAVACALTKTTTTERITGHDLIRRFFDWGGSQKLRHLHHAIEELRSVWLLPVCSSKSQPYGYWIATDADDFHAWVKVAGAAPIKQLANIRAVAKANFPVLARQLELEFETQSVEQFDSAA